MTVTSALVTLLRRDFTAPAPNRRWVADFTHVPDDRTARTAASRDRMYGSS